jgi:DNA excision repair protein ERCC-4
MMSHLFVKKLYLWPRFHLSVGQELEASQPEVVELYQPLSPSMMQLQSKIVDAMRACLQEMRRSNVKEVSAKPE